MDAPPVNTSNPASGGEHLAPAPDPVLALARRHIPRPPGVRWRPCDNYAGYRMLKQREMYDKPPPPPYIIPGHVHVPFTDSWEQTSGLHPAAAIELGHEVCLRRAKAKANKTARRGKKGAQKGKPRKIRRSRLRHWFGVVWKDSKSLRMKKEEGAHASAGETKALSRRGDSDPAMTESSARTSQEVHASITPAVSSDAEMGE